MKFVASMGWFSLAPQTTPTSWGPLMTKKLILAAAVAGALLSASAANAAIVITGIAGFQPGASAPYAGHTVIYDFNSGSLAANGVTSSVNAMIHAASSDSNGALPGAGDGSQFLSVLGNGTATVTFAELMSEISFDWGSLDEYNTLTINGTDGSAIYVPTPANGDTTSPATNGRFYAYTTGGTKIQSLTFASKVNSMEVDNISGIISAIPEPTTWAMMLVGFFGLGSALRSSRKRQGVVAA